tara:strand:- start:318 stop:542 length:225 start_codon:yes stop_codon:yes gene_type:complete
MLKTIRLAMQYKDSLPLLIDLIKEIQSSVRDDGSISQKERSKILKSFWVLVKSVQDPVKIEAEKRKVLLENKLP